MYILLSFIIVILSLYCYKTQSHWKYRNLPSPGLCLPLIGHSYTLINKTVLEDLSNGIWNIYGKHQRNGLLYMNTFSIKRVWIGDFETVKYVFNLPEVQKRLDESRTKIALPPRSVI